MINESRLKRMIKDSGYENINPNLSIKILESISGIEASTAKAEVKPLKSPAFFKILVGTFALLIVMILFKASTLSTGNTGFNINFGDYLSGLMSNDIVKFIPIITFSAFVLILIEQLIKKKFSGKKLYK